MNRENIKHVLPTMWKKIQGASCEFKSMSYELKFTSYKFKSTS